MMHGQKNIKLYKRVALISANFVKVLFVENFFSGKDVCPDGFYTKQINA